MDPFAAFGRPRTIVLSAACRPLDDHGVERAEFDLAGHGPSAEEVRSALADGTVVVASASWLSRKTNSWSSFRRTAHSTWAGTPSKGFATPDDSTASQERGVEGLLVQQGREIDDPAGAVAVRDDGGAILEDPVAVGREGRSGSRWMSSRHQVAVPVRPSPNST